ncbi:MAG: hypothetical protein SVZ03_15490 [Spirochaetota bacterium]|nr:hypothetical protein [Spirochaetota bacterium]
MDLLRNKKVSINVDVKALSLRIFFRILRIVLLWIPATIIILIIIILLALKFYLSPKRVEGLIVSNFNKHSYGDISLKVREFSPYGGFLIENILIRNGEEFSHTKFLEIESLVLRYGFFSMLIGDIRFDEIGIYKPRIYLTEKNGIWNPARLMKPGEEKPEKEEEEKIEKLHDKGAPLDEINLPISIEFLFKFILKDLRLYVKGEGLHSSIEGLTLDVDLWLPPFKRIPMSLDVVSLINRMSLQLNPKGEMDVSFYSNDAKLNHPLILTWKLIFGRGEEKEPTFSSLFVCGVNRAPVRYKKILLTPLNLLISYDIFYHPVRDYLRLNHLNISFHDKKWFNLEGVIRDITKNQEIDIRMTESIIHLDDLYPYYRSITGDRITRFNGDISIFPFTISGNPSNLDIDGNVNLRRIWYKNLSMEATIPQLVIPISLHKRMNDMEIAVGLRMPHLLYSLERNKGGDNGLAMGLNISSYNNFKEVSINKFDLRFYNPVDERNALHVALEGDINLKRGISGRISLSRFTFLKEPLLGMLPGNIKTSLDSVPLNKPVDMNMNVNLSMKSGTTEADMDMLIKIPDFDINDLRISVDIIQDDKEKKIVLNRFNIASKSRGLSISANGAADIGRSPFSDSDLNLQVKIDSPKMKPVYGPWETSGLIQLAAHMSGDLMTGRAKGSLQIDNLFVKNEEEMISVEDLNFNFPFEYYFTPENKGVSRILLDKSQIIDNENFKERENFTIKSIKAKHPAREMSFEYLKDFAATMFFRNNTFEIVKLKAYVLDGSLYGRDILFNLADMKLENMEYRLILDVPNVDIGKLDDPDPHHKKRDAELSLNANFVGRGVDFSKELNMKGYINIYKIGEKFANRLLKGLNTEKGKSKLGMAQFVVDNSMDVEGFNFNLDKGLMYPTVTFSRKAIGFLFGIENNRVKYDRMPIQEYLRSVSKGDK